MPLFGRGSCRRDEAIDSCEGSNIAATPVALSCALLDRMSQSQHFFGPVPRSLLLHKGNARIITAIDYRLTRNTPRSARSLRTMVASRGLIENESSGVLPFGETPP